jgi:hypothetical protein
MLTTSTAKALSSPLIRTTTEPLLALQSRWGMAFWVTNPGTTGAGVQVSGRGLATL